MKKLLIVLLGLTSLNVYANGCGGEYQPATGTCRIIDSSGRQIIYNVGRPQSSNNGPCIFTTEPPSILRLPSLPLPLPTWTKPLTVSGFTFPRVSGIPSLVPYQVTLAFAANGAANRSNVSLLSLNFIVFFLSVSELRRGAIISLFYYWNKSATIL